MKVLVTGATGFLGSHVAEVLLNEGTDVVALVRDPSRLDPELARRVRETRLQLVVGTLTDPAAAKAAVKGVDAVIHVAGLVQGRKAEEFMRVNRDGTENLLRAVEESGSQLKRFILISSQAAGEPSHDGRPVSEEDTPRPPSAYGRSKLAGEERALARAGRFEVTILRPPVIFGPRDRQLEPLFRAIAAGWMVTWGRGENAFNFVYVADMARAAVLALEVPHPSGEIFYTAGERVFTWNSFAQELARVAGVRLKTIHVPPVAFRAGAALSTAWGMLTGRPPWLSFDKLNEVGQPAWLCTSRKAREILGWTPETPFEEALGATLAWYGSRGRATR